MRSLIVVAVGGIAGATLRWLVAELVDHEPSAFPWATLAVNLVGCLAIGVAAQRIGRDSLLWDGIVVGLLGGLTTFSAFAVETRQLVDADRAGLAITYVVASVVAGLAATALAEAGSRR